MKKAVIRSIKDISNKTPVLTGQLGCVFPTSTALEKGSGV